MILLNGDCLEQMKTLQDNSVDSIVTDPPYGLSFMGKKWDYDVPSIEIWREALRVLKPGGHLLSFGGTRTYHRLVVNIEDGGFEIRDCIQWLYGSGFPKSHNIKEGDFKGWGTALKPANEPICVARKPLGKGLTVAENVIKWGCGAINIDGSRIVLSETDKKSHHLNGNSCNQTSESVGNEFLSAANKKDKQNAVAKDSLERTKQLGRWPANLILDEVAAEMLDVQSGADVSRFFYVAKASKCERNAGLEGMPEKSSPKFDGGDFFRGEGNNAKEQKSANFHPTVKPIKLMQYLIKLVTPPSGIVLDPFMGSGSTGVAARDLGFEFIGIERSPEYFEISRKRIEL